jgi:mannose/cellobiose epimerase-like protein (N-acyl-D-glucosamine 2-epimerase family)
MEEVMALTQTLTVMGVATDIDPENRHFAIRCLDGTVFNAFITGETAFWVLQNLDNLENDRVETPPGFDDSPGARMRKYLRDDRLVAVEGVAFIGATGTNRFDARTVRLLSSGDDALLFEDTHWWLTQTARLADQWLDSLFGDRRDYRSDDFVALYRTDLNIVGLPTDDDVQECAVLSRLIYGFSAAYLLTGQDRYRHAARAGVEFQRDAFRIFSHDGRYCLWAHGRRRQKYGTQLLLPSDSGDDAGSIPLYEQIYALAGLALFYRISLDPEVLSDISRTMAAFNSFFLDEPRDDLPLPGKGGWFSHVDYITLRPDRNKNPVNNLKKNWNSVGDHIPAYLINLLLALDPLPDNPLRELAELRGIAVDMLIKATDLIITKFPDPDSAIPYVNERFDANWDPDHEYSWQQNRAVIGHNFKIAWNLTRVANYLETLEPDAHADRGSLGNNDRIAKCRQMARRLARSMTELGVDQIRGGCFDTVEREPSNGEAVEFAWLNTKDFWQQEQAILAYLIVWGHERDEFYLTMARRTEAFWNLFFLDRQNRGIFFRVTDNGLAVTDPNYNVRGGHSDASGYHCFELNFLAHIYNRTYVAHAKPRDARFCLYFHPCPSATQRSLNVLPDAVGPGVRIASITVDGVPRQHFDPSYFQVPLTADDLDRPIAVELCVEPSVSKSGAPLASALVAGTSPTEA